MKLLWTWGALVILTTQALAQGILPPTPADAPSSVATNPVPFAPETPTDAELDSAIDLSVHGRSALDDGIFTAAVSFLKKALAIPHLDSFTKDSLNLDLVTAYLSEGQLNQANDALLAVADTSTPAYLLRAVLLQSRKENWDGPDGAVALLARMIPGNLSSADLPWYYAAQAKLAEHQSNADAANKYWQQAIDHAPPVLQNQFQAALWDSQFLLSKTPTPAEVETLHKEMDAAALPSQSAHFASLYAIGLDKLGQHDDALKVVKQWISVTDLDHKNRDMLRLIWVYLYGKGPIPTDPALADEALKPETQLKGILQESIDVNSPDRDAIKQMQEQALSLLMQQVFGEQSGGDPVVTGSADSEKFADLEKFVDGILADPDADSHPLLEELYLFKAHLALLLNQPDEAKAAASQLLKLYPPATNPDAYVTDALMVLAQVYWHKGQADGQPRLAISYLVQVQDRLPTDQRAPIERWLAYLYFMNGDYQNAAESYTKLLKNPGPDSPLSPGELLLRAVESELRAGSIDNAVKIMDDPASLDIDQDDRWSAEYNLLMAMRDGDRSDAAFQRLNHKLDPEHKNLLRPELYLRLLWLKAYLAVGLSDPGAGKIVDDLQKEIEALTPDVIAGLHLPPDERKTLADMLPHLSAEVLLLQGTSQGQARQYDEQHKTFELLRQNFSGTDPAMESYLVEAGELDRQSKFTEAQRLYNTLSDSFSNSDATSLAQYYAPLALFCSALDSAQLGKTEDALGLLQKFVDKYKDDPAQKLRLYDVRIRQAYLEGKIDSLASWENARDIYGVLIKDYVDNPSLVAGAKVGHAVALFQMAGLPDANPQRRQDAINELRALYHQTNLPVDARVEVGYMLGKSLEQGSKPNLGEATDIYYSVKKDILDDPTLAKELDNTPYGRTWMLRCLVALKQILAGQNNNTEAARIDQIITGHGLAPTASPTSLAPVPVSPVAPAPASVAAPATTPETPSAPAPTN